MARYVDLSHDITDGMQTYPGLPGPTTATVLSREDSRSRYAEGTEFHIGIGRAVHEHRHLSRHAVPPVSPTATI